LLWTGRFPRTHEDPLKIERARLKMAAEDNLVEAQPVRHSAPVRVFARFRTVFTVQFTSFAGSLGKTARFCRAPRLAFGLLLFAGVRNHELLAKEVNQNVY
jgi:hypothetical protein